MPSELAQRYEALRAENPHLFAFDAALRLGVSEAELLAARVGDGVTRLEGPLAPILGELSALGDVKTMTRNKTAVLERWGAFGVAELDAHVGQVVGEDIDLRIFPRRFQSAFALVETTARGVRHSLQFFDGHGTSIHKVYLEDAARTNAFEAIVERHRSANQSAEESVEPEPAPNTAKPSEPIDVAGLREAWDAMKDTHEFFSLLRRFGVTRTQALELAGEERAYRVQPKASLQTALGMAAEAEARIMIFVGNRGLIQIHTGAVRTVKERDGWLNILDPRVNLHVKGEGLASAWVVRKPTADGIVTSLELFDAASETVLMMFGERKPGKAELPSWRAIVARLPRAGGPST